MLETYRIPFLLALGLHALLILAFALSPSTPTAPKAPSKSAPAANVTPVQAVAVNPQQIQTQIEQIKAAEEAKQQAARKQQEDLQKQANAAEKKRLQEEARFAKIKEAQKKAEKDLAEKQKAATAELEKIKKQQLEEKKKLEADKAKEAKEAKKPADSKKTKEDKEKALQEKLASEESKTDNAKTTEDKPSEKKNELDSKIQGEIEKYQGLITQAIGRQWIVPENVNQELSTKLLIRLAPGGMVIDVKLVTSSGDAALDRSAIAAVHKASPLPVPEDADAFDKFREFNLTVQPKNIVSR